MIYLYQLSFSLVVNYHVYCKLAATHLPQNVICQSIDRIQIIVQSAISVRQLSEIHY